MIHGTTQNAEGWTRLAQALKHRGHRCHTPTLPADDDTNLDGYVEAIREQLPTDVDEPTVVAHSGGGLLLPATARALAAGHQVWLAASIPDGRHTLMQEVIGGGDLFNPEWIGQDPTDDPVAATYFLFHDCDYATLHWALTILRAFYPRQLYDTAIELEPDIASTYVVCTDDRTLRPSWARQQAALRLNATVVELDAGHCPHVSRPEALAEALTRIGQR